MSEAEKHTMEGVNYQEKYEMLLEEYARLKKENDELRIFYNELESTNNHLVSATWRERDMKKQLADALNELKSTKSIVEAQNKKIADSINYSRKIQAAINPSEHLLRKMLPESFILYKPKDVISGDFPWLFENGRYLYVAAVDCTGHGVPGAMMSMIGNLLLNAIAKTKWNIRPSEILFQLHHAVIKTLKQDLAGSDSKDGMDIGLLRLDIETREMLYAGAHRPLLFLRQGEIHQVKGDKFPIGGVQYKGKNEYNDHKLDPQQGDVYLMFSDGLTDQTGGPEGRKLMTSGVSDILKQYPGASMEILREVYDHSFEIWKGAHKQLDDVLLIGIKI